MPTHDPAPERALTAVPTPPPEPSPAMEIFRALAADLAAYADTGSWGTAAKRGPALRALLARFEDEGRLAIKAELRDAILDLRTTHTGKETAALLGYRSVSSLDQILKGYRGDDYGRQRYPGTVTGRARKSPTDAP